MGKFVEATLNADAKIAAAFPKYLVDTHGRILLGAGELDGDNLSVATGQEDVYDLNIVNWMEGAADNNPYSLITSYDPDDDINEMLDAIETLQTQLDALDPTTDFATYMASADSAFTAYGVDTSDDADAEITAHAKKKLPELNNARASHLATMFELNTVNTSFHVMGMAHIEAAHLWQLEDFRAKLKLHSNDSKNRFLISCAEMMYNSQARKYDFTRNNVLAELDFYRTKIQTKHTETQQNLQWDIADINWEADVLATASRFVAGLQGVPVSTREPSNMSMAIANAMSVGPQIGMQIGQMTGNPGAGALAAVLGGGMAFLGGLIQ